MRFWYGFSPCYFLGNHIVPFSMDWVIGPPKLKGSLALDDSMVPLRKLNIIPGDLAGGWCSPRRLRKRRRLFRTPTQSLETATTLCSFLLTWTKRQIINWLPFRRHIVDFSCGLGPANSHLNATREKTFSTTTFKASPPLRDCYLVWIIATTTKICTSDDSIPHHCKTCASSPRPSTR